MKFLVDSGSMVLIIPVSILLCAGTPTKLKLYAANNTEIATYSSKLFELDIGLRRVLKWSFLIVDVKTAILGADFLVKYGLIIDLKRKKPTDSTTSLTLSGKICSTKIHTVSTIGVQSEYNDLRKYIDITTPSSTMRSKSSTVSHEIITDSPPIAARP